MNNIQAYKTPPSSTTIITEGDILQLSEVDWIGTG